MPGRRVVVADNDRGALELVLTDLSLEGHDIVGAADNGESALQLCRELRPDVLVIDYRMPPGPNGADVAGRARAEFPSMTVVVFTNYDTSEVRRAVQRAGAQMVIKGRLGDLRRAVAG